MTRSTLLKVSVDPLSHAQEELFGADDGHNPAHAQLRLMTAPRKGLFAELLRLKCTSAK